LRASRSDTVVLDVEARELRVELSDDELEARLEAWSPPGPLQDRRPRQVRKLVSSASGAITRPS
jgi:dihydroxyacid dehydratase/phosphogluconate dehydratase